MGGGAAPGETGSMHRNPLITFHRSAEAAGYPALQIVAMLCLGLVVAAVGLLAVTGAVWALALALLSILFALAMLTKALEAAFGETEEPIPLPADAQNAAKTLREPKSTAPSGEHEPEAGHERSYREAA
jgi:hypothetical protein